MPRGCFALLVLLPLLLLLPLPRLLPRLQWLWEWLRRGWLKSADEKLSTVIALLTLPRMTLKVTLPDSRELIGSSLGCG